MYLPLMPVSEESNISSPNYRWPFFVAGSVALWIIITVIWMVWGVDQARQDREQGRESYPYGNQLNQSNRFDDHE
tara:strand:- start:214 stop:438 length:225 start_codon:yes stop_codon:yes gene_type:complete